MTDLKESYLTVNRDFGPEEMKEKGSRFISRLFPVTSAEEADGWVARLRKEYKDPTHVCSAFRLGDHNGEETYFRFSDDGEPGGTAGLPIFNEIKSKDYLNVLVAVIRYFGGTKLGKGGLVRAYGASARMVLEVSQPHTVFIKEELDFDFPYGLTGEVMQVINHYDLDVLQRDYGAEGVFIRLAVPVAKTAQVVLSFSDISGGKIKI